MLESLDKYGLPKKYALIGFAGGMLGVLITYFLDLSQSQTGFIATPFGAAIGGYIGGLIRQKRGKDS